jgi:hypothetical protein
MEELSLTVVDETAEEEDAMGVVDVEAGTMVLPVKSVTKVIMMHLSATTGTLALCLAMVTGHLLSFHNIHHSIRFLLPLPMVILQGHNALLLLRLCSLEAVPISTINGGTLTQVLLTM